MRRRIAGIVKQGVSDTLDLGSGNLACDEAIVASTDGKWETTHSPGVCRSVLKRIRVEFEANLGQAETAEVTASVANRAVQRIQVAATKTFF